MAGVCALFCGRYVWVKICIECGKERKLDEFHKDKSRQDGHNTRCKYCVNEMKRLRYGDAKVVQCEKCYFLVICKANIWDMNFWPYCMRRE